MDIKLIDQAAVAGCLGMGRTIELMKGAYEELSAGRVDSPLRTALVNDGGTVLYKPAYSEEAGIFCVKVVSVFKGNSVKGLPVTPGVIVVNSGETGMPVAILEAGYLTSLRTGACTGVATDILAPKDVKVGALFGTGGQARHQLEAMLCVRNFERIYVFSRCAENADRFCEEHADLAGDCGLIANPERGVLRECEVITTATTSGVAVFGDDEISDTVHVNAIGSLGAERTELTVETLLRSDVVVDQRLACLAEAGEICLMRDAGLIGDDYAPVEIGEVIAGVASTGERDRPTVFKSVGNAVQDLVCAAEIYRMAVERRLGVEACL